MKPKDSGIKKCISIILLTKFVGMHSVHKSLKMHTQCITTVTPLGILSKEHITFQCSALVTLQNLYTLWEHCVSSAIKREILAWS